ncbi:hydroxyacylglutathione hydrolase-like protein isoform 1-T1 [Leptosomus discolor]
MKVKVISVLEDNYMYLVIEESTRDAVAVDAAVPKRILRWDGHGGCWAFAAALCGCSGRGACGRLLSALSLPSALGPLQLLEIIRKEDVVLRAILTTHHHWDHAKGNEELARLCPGLRVYGADERIGALTHKVTHDQELTFGAIRVRCLFTPCHTSGHMCYFMWEDGSPDAPALFSGDTLFVGGCGKFFEGTAEQMYTNLTQILGTLPKETKVFCGHECTVRNLKFALKVEPENEIVKKKLAWAKQRDDEDLPTVPSTLQEEFLYNPFLRVTEEPLQKFTGKTDPVEVLRTLRTEKDNFKKPKERPHPQAVLAFDWGLFSPFLEKK